MSGGAIQVNQQWQGKGPMGGTGEGSLMEEVTSPGSVTWGDSKNGDVSDQGVLGSQTTRAEWPSEGTWSRAPWLVGCRSEWAHRFPPPVSRWPYWGAFQQVGRRMLWPHHPKLQWHLSQVTTVSTTPASPWPLPLKLNSSFRHSLRPHPKESYGICLLCPNLPPRYSCTHRSSPVIAVVIPKAPSE